MPESASLPTSATGNSRAGKSRPWLIAALLALLLFYVLSSYYSVWRFLDAVKTADGAALSARVNFPEVREAMKRQLRDHFFPDGKRAKKGRLENLSASAGPSLIDQLVDAYLTPDGLAALLANPKIAAASAQPTLLTLNANPVGVRQNVSWSKVRYAFFSSPREFLVDLSGTKLRFRLSGLGWKLWRAELPLDELTKSY